MTVYDFEALTLDGHAQRLDAYRGHTLLIVNVASKCGFTPQYQGLETLYRSYRERRFAVLGFPCDQFGHQEPGNEADIRQFCSMNYGISFPLFAKVEVNGPNAHPLFRYLKKARRGVLGTEAIKWNFTKFLVNDSGEPVGRYAPSDTPESIEKVLVELLGASRI